MLIRTPAAFSAPANYQASLSVYYTYDDPPIANSKGKLTKVQNGAVGSKQLGNGRWESTVFNSRLQPTQIALGTVQNGSDKLKLNFDYGTTNNNGNVLSQTITVPTETRNNQTYAAFTAVQTYSYDSLNRIKDAKEMIGETQQWKQKFEYDRYGNRRFDANNTTTLAPGCPTAVCNPTIDPATNKLIGYSFDNAGNTKIDAENRQFIYDGENKQVEIKDQNGASIGKYYYNGDGQRVKKLSATESTVFIYNASGQLVGEYATQIAQPQDAKVSYLTTDHLGSPRVITDALGNVTSRRDFMPFGDEVNAAAASPTARTAAQAYTQPDSVRQKFTSYERDEEIDLDYALARMYSKNHGRFTTTDPLYFQLMMAIDPQRFNLFVYTRNNPLKWVDPNGERLHLRGDTAWLQTNVLYQMAGTQEDFDKYFEIKEGQVLLREGVDVSNASEGIRELAGLVNDVENYLFFTGTDSKDVNALFQGATDGKGGLTSIGKTIANEFAAADGRTTGGGTFVRTNGRQSDMTPANIANGDPVFAVIAYNTNATQTQQGVSSVISGFSNIETETQKDGIGKVVKPVSFFIHESTENREFASQKRAGQPFNYNSAHTHAMKREASLRKALGIAGGFSGGALITTINNKK